MKTNFNRLFFIAFLCFICFPTIFYAQIVPVYKDIKYGPYERNTMDVWLASSDKPTPLVIYVHGGGFTAGDKSGVNKEYLLQFLKSGISFISINYRYRTNETEGVFASLKDSKRALQFIRYKSKAWNIDKEKIGMFGGSAGAGTSLWLAFHDDMADPGNVDPVLRESTRLEAAGAFNPQSTYDLLQWPKLLGFEAPEENKSTWEKEMLDFFGMKNIKEFESEKGKNMRVEADMLSMISHDDPPFIVSCDWAGDIPPKTKRQFIHHPIHSKRLVDKAKEKNVNVIASIPALGYNDKIDVVSFFKEKLK